MKNKHHGFDNGSKSKLANLLKNRSPKETPKSSNANSIISQPKSPLPELIKQPLTRQFEGKSLNEQLCALLATTTSIKQNFGFRTNSLSQAFGSNPSYMPSGSHRTTLSHFCMTETNETLHTEGFLTPKLSVRLNTDGETHKPVNLARKLKQSNKSISLLKSSPLASLTPSVAHTRNVSFTKSPEREEIPPIGNIDGVKKRNNAVDLTENQIEYYPNPPSTKSSSRTQPRAKLVSPRMNNLKVSVFKPYSPSASAKASPKTSFISTKEKKIPNKKEEIGSKKQQGIEILSNMKEDLGTVKFSPIFEEGKFDQMNLSIVNETIETSNRGINSSPPKVRETSRKITTFSNDNNEKGKLLTKRNQQSPKQELEIDKEMTTSIILQEKKENENNDSGKQIIIFPENMNKSNNLKPTIRFENASEPSPSSIVTFHLGSVVSKVEFKGNENYLHPFYSEIDSSIFNSPSHKGETGFSHVIQNPETKFNLDMQEPIMEFSLNQEQENSPEFKKQNHFSRELAVLKSTISIDEKELEEEEKKAEAENTENQSKVESSNQKQEEVLKSLLNQTIEKSIVDQKLCLEKNVESQKETPKDEESKEDLSSNKSLNGDTSLNNDSPISPPKLSNIGRHRTSTTQMQLKILVNDGQTSKSLVKTSLSSFQALSPESSPDKSLRKLPEMTNDISKGVKDHIQHFVSSAVSNKNLKKRMSLLRSLIQEEEYSKMSGSANRASISSMNEKVGSSSGRMASISLDRKQSIFQSPSARNSLTFDNKNKIIPSTTEFEEKNTIQHHRKSQFGGPVMLRKSTIEKNILQETPETQEFKSKFKFAKRKTPRDFKKSSESNILISTIYQNKTDQSFLTKLNKAGMCGKEDSNISPLFVYKPSQIDTKEPLEKQKTLDFSTLLQKYDESSPAQSKVNPMIKQPSNRSLYGKFPQCTKLMINIVPPPQRENEQIETDEKQEEKQNQVEKKKHFEFVFPNNKAAVSSNNDFLMFETFDETETKDFNAEIYLGENCHDPGTVEDLDDFFPKTSAFEDFFKFYEQIVSRKHPFLIMLYDEKLKKYENVLLSETREIENLFDSIQIPKIKDISKALKEGNNILKEAEKESDLKSLLLSRIPEIETSEYEDSVKDPSKILLGKHHFAVVSQRTKLEGRFILIHLPIDVIRVLNSQNSLTLYEYLAIEELKDQTTTEREPYFLIKKLLKNSSEANFEYISKWIMNEHEDQLLGLYENKYYLDEKQEDQDVVPPKPMQIRLALRKKTNYLRPSKSSELDEKPVPGPLNSKSNSHSPMMEVSTRAATAKNTRNQSALEVSDDKIKITRQTTSKAKDTPNTHEKSFRRLPLQSQPTPIETLATEPTEAQPGPYRLLEKKPTTLSNGPGQMSSFFSKSASFQKAVSYRDLLRIPNHTGTSSDDTSSNKAVPPKNEAQKEENRTSPSKTNLADKYKNIKEAFLRRGQKDMLTKPANQYLIPSITLTKEETLNEKKNGILFKSKGKHPHPLIREKSFRRIFGRPKDNAQVDEDYKTLKKYENSKRMSMDPIKQLFCYVKDNRIAELKELFMIYPHLKVDISDEDGKFALGIAAQCGFSEIIEILIQRNATLEVQDLDGNTPLHLALAFSQDHAADQLILSGASQNKLNKDGKTPWELVQ